MKKGTVPFRLEYFEATGGNALQWTIRPPGSDKARAASAYFKKL